MSPRLSMWHVPNAMCSVLVAWSALRARPLGGAGPRAGGSAARGGLGGPSPPSAHTPSAHAPLRGASALGAASRGGDGGAHRPLSLGQCLDMRRPQAPHELGRYAAGRIELELIPGEGKGKGKGKG